MYHMARGYDESSRLMSDHASTSSSAPNLTVNVDPQQPVDARPTVYGSMETAVATSSDTEPLIDLKDDRATSRDNPKV